MGRKSGKVSRLPPPFPQGFISEPGDHPHDIHRGGIEQLLEVRAREAEVATLAQIKAPDALREATLHARPQRILSFKLRRLLTLSRRLDRFVVGLGADGELAWRIFGCGAYGTGGTGATSNSNFGFPLDS